MAARKADAAAPDDQGLTRGMSGLFRVLRGIEVAGNKLPHPFWLFWILAIVLVLVSWLLSSLGVSAVDPSTGDTVAVRNLLSADGVQVVLGDALTNFAGFPPLATIVVVLLGVAVAERSGLLEAVMRASVARVPASLVTFALSFTAMVAHVAGDSAFIVLVPLGALVFRAVGKSPVLGVIVAFVSVSAGYDASPLLTTTDVLLSGLTTAAAQTVDPSVTVTAVDNYFFGLGSSVVLALTITVFVEKVLARRPDLAADTDADAGDPDALRLAPEESRGIRNAGIALLVVVVLLVAAMVPVSSPLRGEDGSLVESTLVMSIAYVLGFVFALLGYVYGRTAGTVAGPGEVPDMMAEGVRQLAPILVLFFAISQFLAYFTWTGISTVLAVNGSEVLQRLDAHPLVVLAGVVVMVTLINLVVTSGSAQWALVAPVVVPMLMYVDIPPQTTQAVYRIADSCTNAITPMSPYFVLALGYVQRYRKDAGIGTLLSFTVPVVTVMLVVWCTFFAVWYLLGIPLGPGAPVR